jgi:ribosomal protein S18 acetylase RimI-like enzyme
MSNATAVESRTAVPAPRTLRRFEDGMTITTFDPAHRSEFRRLNIAWLERYFKVEPIDELVLGDPESQIIAPGGEILFAMIAGQVVGTVGLKVEDEDSFELTKMAVDSRWQGRGYGQRLLESALDLARERGKERVILYTQTALEPAIALYRKNGFTTSTEPLCQRYERCDIKMWIDL